MSNYSLLQNAIFGIDAGKFQKVCEFYMQSNYKGEFAAPGSVENKDKTRPGRPDIYWVLENGKFVIAEVTTHDDLDKNGYAKKLKKDLRDCLDTSSIGIDSDKVEQIVLFTNGTLQITVRDELAKMAEDAGKKMTVVGFSTLMHFLYNEGKLFAKDYLSIPFVTGQILNKQQFLAMYQGKIATPLSNQLFGRETELEKLIKLIEKRQIVSISGKAGVGKSRIALEAIDIFLEKQPSFIPLYILTTPDSITEDIISHIIPGKQYVVFIDDANRQLSGLMSVLAKALGTGIDLKLVVTVRDYAKKELEKHFSDRDFERVSINVLNDEVIQQILFFEPFNLKDAVARNRIVKLCLGNARLAIMACATYQKESNIDILKDNSSIYDAYFQSIFNDNGIFTDPLYVKVLGLVSFFLSIDVAESDDLEILANFGISEVDFTSCIHLLESMEIVETKYLTIAKLSDQVLGTYFFYQAYLKRNLLDVNLLVKNYFSSHTSRIRDTFLPAISAFGTDKVFANHMDFIEEFLIEFKDDRYVTVRFFEIFGQYFPWKLFPFFDKQIENEPADSSDFDFTNAYVDVSPTTGDMFLSLLTPFYTEDNSYFKTALGLAIKYVYKHKGFLDILLHQLKKDFYQNEDDLANGFRKLRTCYNYLVDKINYGIPEKTLFYYLMQHALLHKDFDRAMYVRIGEEITLIPDFQALRISFLVYMSNNYQTDRDIVYDLLIGYLDISGRNAHIYLRADQAQLAELIDKNLSPDNFADAYFVQQYLDLLFDKKVKPISQLMEIRERFINVSYQVIDILSMNRSSRRRNANNEDFNSYWEAQVALVKSEIKVSSLVEYEEIADAAEQYFQFPYWNRIDIAMGFSLVLENVFQKDTTLGFMVLDTYLESGNLVGFGPVRLFNTIFNLNLNLHVKLFACISRAKYKEKQKWLQSFFEFLPDDLVGESVLSALFSFASEIEQGYELHLQYYQKYEQKYPGAIKDLVTTLSRRNNEKGKGLLKLPHHFFIQYPYLAETNYDLAVSLYIEQEKSDPSFDPVATDLLFLTSISNVMFKQYIDFRIEKYKEFFIAPRKYLGNIWELVQADDLVYMALTKVGLVRMSGVGREDFWGVFFINLKAEYKAKAIDVLYRIVSDYADNHQMLNMCWYVLRNYLKEAYPEAIRMWITKNTDFKSFKRMDWTNHHFDYANGLPSQQRISAIQTVVDVLMDVADPINYLHHLSSLIKEIELEQKQSDSEIKRMYRGLW